MYNSLDGIHCDTRTMPGEWKKYPEYYFIVMCVLLQEDGTRKHCDEDDDCAISEDKSCIFVLFTIL